MKSSPHLSASTVVASVVLIGLIGGGVVVGYRSYQSFKTKTEEKPPAVIEASRAPEHPTTKPAPPESARPTTPRLWVVAIGIDQYRDNAIASCRGAVRAANAVAQWVTETAGWGEEHVLLMDERGQETPGDPAKTRRLLPTLSNLQWAFKTWLPARVKPDDTVLVYFAGHAIALPPRPEEAPGSPGRDYLLPVDARKLQWEKSGWMLDQSIDALASAGQNPIVCWLDTSVQGRGERLAPPADLAPNASSLLHRLVRWPGVTAWIAADDKPSVEAERVGELSPFTAGLLKGLGTTEQPGNLVACLERLRRDETLRKQGFRTLGGVDPGLDLWVSSIRRASLLKRELLLQRGHAGAVSTLAFSADGTRLYSGAQDSTVKYWSIADRRLLRSWNYHTVGVTSLALNTRGDRLASGDGAGWLRLQNLIKQEEAPPSPPHERGVDRVGFLPDSTLLASLDMDGRAWLQDAEDPTRRSQLLTNEGTGLAVSTQPGPVGFVVAERSKKLSLFGPNGKPIASLEGPGGVVTLRRIASNGTRIAAADDQGQLLIHDATANKELVRKSLSGPVEALALSDSGRLAVASGAVLTVTQPGAESPADQTLTLPASANLVAFSQDDRWLVACASTGALRAWRLDENAVYQPVELEDMGEASNRATTTFAISPDGRKLVSGDQDGGLRFWDLPDGHQRPPILARRGQVAALSISADARYLLQVSQDRQAQVWDLENGRGLGLLPGDWVSGVLSPDGLRVYLSSDQNGDLMVLERADGRILPTVFERPKGFDQRFGKVAVSPDGRWVVAGSSEGPVACLWNAASGKLIQTARGHLDPHSITAVGFSGDSTHWLTASEDGTAKIWARDDANPAPEPVTTFSMTDPQSGEPLPITAAQIAPDAPQQVVAGAIDGRLLFYDGEKKPVDMGNLGHAVHAVTFTPDGKWIAAAGADKSVWMWSASQPRQRLRLEPAPQHAEQVNALIAWPNSRIIASGSDDTTIRLWYTGDRSLLGTLSAQQGTNDWVAYTPDGLFDCSIGGEGQVTWLDNKVVLSLEQVYDQFHVFKLTDQLRKGDHPKAPSLSRRPPPRLTIDQPANSVSEQRLARLSISVSEPGLENLRLYQNGIPVLSSTDLRLDESGNVVTGPLPLKHGLNRFHVMASRPESTDIEGKSELIEIRYDGPETPGQLHLVAVGVSDYDDPAHRLQFADRDAQQLSDFLERVTRESGSSPGLQLVIKNREVSETKVNEAFEKIRDRVRNRPEDTVAVFLAGHADLLDGQFHLLLSTFPFDQNDPKTGRPRQGTAALDLASNSLLPYVAVYRNLSRLGALQRVVMIDACQAEAIEDDPGIRVIQELVDTQSQKAKTAYLLAARRGEPAGEVAALAHGLMTYSILKGLGDSQLETVKELTLFDELPTADQNRDGLVTTDELRWYTGLTVPRLADSFPALVMRTGASNSSTQIRPTANLGQKATVQASSVSFPLVELPKPSQTENSENSTISEK